MNAILFEESITLEFNQLFEECDKSIAYASARLMEEGLMPSYITEAEGERTGGLVGFIGEVLKAISNLISGTAKKVKSILFGSKVDESKKDVQIEGVKNPDGLADIVNGTIKSGKDMLNKAAKGEVTPDEARKWVGDKKANLAALAETSLGAAALFGLTKVAQGKMDSWKNEIDEAYANNKKSMSSLAEQVARTKGGVTKEQNEEATKIIVNGMRDISGDGIKGIEGALKKLYASRYVSEKLAKDAEVFTDPKARKQAMKDAKKRTGDTTKEIHKLEDLDKNIKTGSKIQKDLDESDAYNRARKAEAENKVYNNVNKHIDEDEIKGKAYTAADKRRDTKSIRRSNNITKAGRALKGVFTRNDGRAKIKN